MNGYDGYGRDEFMLEGLAQQVRNELYTDDLTAEVSQLKGLLREMYEGRCRPMPFRVWEKSDGR